jgi:hypothetical protein
MIQVLRHLPGAGIKARQESDIRARTHEHARCPRVTHLAVAGFAGEFDPLPERDEFVQAFDDHPTGQGGSELSCRVWVLCVGAWKFCRVQHIFFLR